MYCNIIFKIIQGVYKTMGKDDEKFDISPKNMTVPLIVVQAICIGILLLSVLIIKLGFKNSFGFVQDFCKNSILEPTQVTDVFEEEKL